MHWDLSYFGLLALSALIVGVCYTVGVIATRRLLKAGE